jgi:hypothetical protein
VAAAQPAVPLLPSSPVPTVAVAAKPVPVATAASKPAMAATAQQVPQSASLEQRLAGIPLSAWLAVFVLYAVLQLLGVYGSAWGTSWAADAAW